MNPRRCLLLAVSMTMAVPLIAADCGRECLEGIAQQYLEAYRMRDPARAPFAARVRFAENNVEMPFPDDSWDTVTLQVGRPMVLSDPKNGQVGIFTSILQNDTPTFVGIRLAVRGRRITEVEHILSTRRNLSSPPTPIGDIWTFVRDPDFPEPVPEGQRATRGQLVRHANGYFDTLQFNNGEIRGTRFAPNATRNENGLLFTQIEQGFR